ncbi:MAG: dihydrodipicolinate reductase [Deltaproteobacteria bacterium]|nr:dihydrodipicolinate reductase [Deltaproteobacteria bacterium]
MRTHPYRIILWGTGFVGGAVLRALAGHSGFEVVAVIVNDPAKDRRDIGELLGTGRTGIVATRDAARALAIEADAVAYFGPNGMHAEANLRNVTAALRAGKNVVDTTTGALQNPERAPAPLREAIEAACREGGVSFFSTGIDPGFGNDLLPLTLLGLCGQAESVHATEFIVGGDYPDQASLRMMGLMSDMSAPPLLTAMPGLMTQIWGAPLYTIAEAMGVAVESTREHYERWGTDVALEFPLGRVEPGQCAAHRIRLEGIVLGEPRIVIDHVHRMVEGAAPEWPKPHLHPAHANRVVIRGQPNIELEALIESADSASSNAGGCLATGMRAINAIPSVCAAPPGIVSPLDLPLIALPGTLRARTAWGG